MNDIADQLPLILVVVAVIGMLVFAPGAGDWWKARQARRMAAYRKERIVAIGKLAAHPLPSTEKDQAA